MNTDIAAHRMVHLGLGSFHRAHFAVYVQALLDAGHKDWELQGGNIRDDMPATMAALQAQGGAYTLETVTPQGVRHYQSIRAITHIIPYDPPVKRADRCGRFAKNKNHLFYSD